jgi:glycosidase
MAGWTGLAQPATNNLWRAQSIYQVITDRFYDGDPSNNNASHSYNPMVGNRVHGGDFRGLEQKLDYIKALGATAIWISPIVKNGFGEYHGYAGQDFYAVDPHWGTLADLQSMVKAAHGKDLRVILDVIVNHGADLIGSDSPGYAKFDTNANYVLRYRRASHQYAAPFNTNDANPSLTHLFHNYGAIQNWDDPIQDELGEAFGLDDFRTESAYIRSNMAAVYNYWIREAGFDGFRVDTVKHVEMGFWQDWCPRIHTFAATAGKPDFFIFGEVFENSDARCSSYTGTKGGGPFKLDSVLDYPLFFLSQNVFGSAGGSTKQIEDRFAALARNYDPGMQDQLVTFLDNHDQPRFLNRSTTNRLAVALTFLFTARGIPCLYYGTEQAFNGANDPHDREDMFAGPFKDAGLAGVDSFNMTHPLFELVAKLNNFRRLYPALSLGTCNNSWSDASGPGLLAYTRKLGSQELFVVLNTSITAKSLPPRSTSYAPGTTLVNLFDPAETLIVRDNSLTPAFSVPGTTAKIFIAQSQRLAPDPVVLTNYPAHSAANVPTSSSIVLQFSEPMNTGSVQAAFSINPPAHGRFDWSPAHNQMTFTADGAGLAGSTNVTVRINSTAGSAVSGKTLFAPYELKFSTAPSR